MLSSHFSTKLFDVRSNALCCATDSLTKVMSGGGTSRGSGRAHFRSRLGCCICGTKSSSSRFTASERYAEHFGPCFGEVAARRCGDLCNACVLCVKRWIQRGRQPGYFSQVLDSKQGPGPKHMKEITKRARRREAKQQQMLQLQKQLLHQQQQHELSTRGNSRVSSLMVGTDACGDVSEILSSSPTPTVSRVLHGHHHGHHLVHHSATCVACWADQNNGNNVSSTAAVTAASTPVPAGGTAVVPPASPTSVVRTRSSVSRKLGFAANNAGTILNVNLAADFDVISNLAEISTSSSSSSLHYPQGRSDTTSFLSASLSRSGFGESSSSQVSLCDSHSPASLHHLHENFRPPRPPQAGAILQANGGCATSGISVGGIGSGGGVGVMTRAAASASASNSLGGFFDGASSTASSTTSTPSTPTRRQNRRTRLPPVKISSTGLEVHDILRKIQKDNNNMNMDNRQINMAMQREIRLRNRIVNPPSTAFKGPQAPTDAAAANVSDNSATAAGAVTGNAATPGSSDNLSSDLRV
uniref:Protein FAM60A n=1 Tax=Echinococcus granulosus TaxID=6210 RepID=A0A068X436_ECHGR|nr:protein FAM60A [Echinococcus granulosus]